MKYLSKPEVLLEIEGVIKILSSPLTAEMEAQGWRQQTAARWLVNFKSLHEQVATGAQSPDASIMRAMDHDGITSGILLEKAAVIGNSLRRLLWEQQGCNECREKLLSGRRLPEISSNPQNHIRLQKCPTCKALWLIEERFFKVIAKDEALKQFDIAASDLL